MTPPAGDDEVLGRVYDARLVRRLLEFVRPQSALIALSVVLMFAVTAAQLAQPWIVKRLIDGSILRRDLGAVAGLATLYLVAFAAEQIFRYAQIYAMEVTGQNVILALRRRVFDQLQRLDAEYFDRFPVGRLMTRVTTDVESLADLFSSGVVSLLGDSVKLLAIVVILWWLQWRLALVTFTIVPGIFLMSALLRGRIRQAYRDVRRRIARINAHLQESITGMLLIQMFRREATESREFDAINRDHRDADLRSVVYESVFSAIIELVGTLATALILWYGGREILRGSLTFGALFAFLGYMGLFFAPIRDLSGFYAVLQGAMASLERIFALLDTAPRIVSPAGATAPDRPAGRIEFDAVRFAYGPGKDVLHDVRFSIAPGEKVAIVGATGSGKTTLVKLLVRLYDPAAGAIRIDGRDLRTLPLPWLRRQIGMVLQDHFLFTGTIAGNIAFGSGPLPAGRIADAARLAHADGFIRLLPGGYDEPVLERGGNLSVGQKQLVSFARAVAYDPRILVLDEATSSVDTETESRIQEAMRALLRGRTAILIAHRLSTIAGADRILVLHHGRLVEEGTHRQLLARDGIYARLCRLQFGWDDPISAPGAPDAGAPAVAAGQDGRPSPPGAIDGEPA